MTTGWQWIDSSGEVHKSWMSAVRALKKDPTLTFQFWEIDMSGIHVRDATEEIKKKLKSVELGDEFH